jgi:PAS domain S-box-containing protein
VADALSESRERYRAILDQAADAIFIDDATGRIIDVNLKACQSLGYSRDELLSKSIKEIDQDAAKAAIHHELRSKAIPDGGYTFESRYRRKDGSIIPVEETVGPLRLPHGPATIRMIRDTTERRRAEAYREITREVLQILNQPGSLQDLLKNVVVALKLSTGADAAGIRLQNKDDFPYFFQEGFSNDFLNKENSLINRSSDGICKDSTGQPSLECTCGLVISGRTDPSNPLFTQGGSFWTNNSFPLLDLPDNEDPRILPRNECIHQGYVSIALIPIRSESRIVGLIQLNDRKKGCFTREGVESLEVIAESIGMAVLRKQAEEALSESESRYHNLVDSANEAIVVAQDGMLRFVNPAALALIGVSEQELTSTPFVTFIHPDDSTMVAERFQKRSQGEAVPARYVFRIITKRGDTRWVEMNAIAIDWEERPATLNFMTDITEHKKMVEELRRSNTELQQFAYVASHDLQEPLRMVVSYLTLLEKKYRDKLDPGAQEFIHYAVDGGNRMRNLIDDLLEYSRVDTKSKEFVLVDMNDVVARTLANISVVIEESKAEILVDSLPTIVADKSQMVQVMQNLVSNAIKFRGPDRPKISISAPIKSGEWTIAVKDNGIGLSMEFSEKIFLMFQRLHTAREYPGTGVGLAIAKKIIDRHGGHIWVESKEGNGSTFFFSIPRNRRTD